MGPFKCCVGGCTSTSETHKLFSFPRNDSLRNLWMSFLVPTNSLLIGLSKGQLRRNRVCEKHFDKHQFDEQGKRLRHSYPCLFTDNEIAHGEALPSAGTVQNALSDHNYFEEQTDEDDDVAEPLLVIGRAGENYLEHPSCSYSQSISSVTEGQRDEVSEQPSCSFTKKNEVHTVSNGSHTRQLHELNRRERAGVTKLREVLEDRLQEIKRAKTWKHERVLTSPQGTKVTVKGAEGEFLNFCANNYLGLSNNPEVVEAAREGLKNYGAGLSSVRFICGTQTIHKELENRLAQFHGREDAILYGSCFDANAGLFESMLTPEDAVFSDALNHASIIDGVRLCKAQKFRYPHRDLNELEHLLAHSEARLKLIVTDGVFSMDGTVAPIRGLRDLADKYRALLAVDDSHATGFFGETGRGTEEYCGVNGAADIICSTLGKAISGAAGGYTTGPKELVTLLRNVSRPYLFSNAPPPAIVTASLKSLDLVERSGVLREHLRENTRVFREGMKAAGLTVAGDEHPICPVMVGEASLAVDLASGMLERGIYVVAFSYPVVPKGAARVRVQISAAHTLDDVNCAVQAFADVAKNIGLIKS